MQMKQLDNIRSLLILQLFMFVSYQTWENLAWENGITERVGCPFNLLDQPGSIIHQEY